MRCRRLPILLLSFNQISRYHAQISARSGCCPVLSRTCVIGKFQMFLRPCDADKKETLLLLFLLKTFGLQRNQPIIHTCDKNMGKLQPFGCMKCHKLYSIVFIMYLFFQNIRSIQRRHIQKFRKTFHDIFLLLFLVGGHALQKVHDADSVFYIRSCRWMEMIFQRKIVPEVFCCCGLSVEICLRKSKHLLTDI